MVTIPIDYIHGDHLVNIDKPQTSDQSSYSVNISDLIKKFPTATKIETGSLLDNPVYEIETPNTVHLVDARSGKDLSPLSKTTILTIAQKLYAGPGPILSIRLLTDNPPSEIQSRPLPLWQVNFHDLATPTLYISPVTGKLIAKRHDFWRAFDFLWMLHIMDYEDRSDVNNWLLRIAATLVILSALTGIWLLFYSFNNKRSQAVTTSSSSLKGQFFRTIHKWLGLIIGLQVIIWCATGLGMSILHHETVQGDDRSRHLAPQTLFSKATQTEIIDIINLKGLNSFQKLTLRNLNGQLVYQITDKNGDRLIDARLGQPVIVDEKTSRKIAVNDYSGSAKVLYAQTVQMPTSDTPNEKGPAWKIDFDDDRQTALYISVETGHIVARRNDTWRIFDFFIMLHFMDYPGNLHFNSPWIIAIAFFSLWLAISGVILLFQSFTLTEFKAAWNRILRRKTSLNLTVLDIYGGLDNKFATEFGTPVYNSLAQAGINLPSSCGGGGTCGLCRVKFINIDAPVLSADQHHLSQKELDEGYRLSCQHRLIEDIAVEIPQEILSQKPYQAEVVSSKFLTPNIKEITLRVPSSDIFSYRAGSYMLADIPTDDETTISRAYSLATPSEENPQEIVLNVRQMPAPANQPDIPTGIGSSYMCSLKVGEKITLSGPFGHFAAKDSDREMILIGGGAGMAPLRAIIRDQLLYKKTDRKISFWYGVRNREDIFYQEEFESLMNNHKNMMFQIGLSEPKKTDNWSGPTGFIHKITMEHYLSDHPDLSNSEFYLCGPPAMLAATRTMLHDLGIPEDNISYDDFGI